MMQIPQHDSASTVSPQVGKPKSGSRRRAQKRRRKISAGHSGQFDHLPEMLSLAVLPITFLPLLLSIVASMHGNS
jgi:hypothetical protein